MKKLLTYFFVILVSLVFNNQSLRLFVGNTWDYTIPLTDDQNSAEENPESEGEKDLKLKYSDDFILENNLLLNPILEIFGSAYMHKHEDCSSKYNGEVFYPPKFIS